MNNKRIALDFPLFFTAIGLWVFGSMLVYSATINGKLASIFDQQVLWVVMGVIVILVVVSVPTTIIYKLTPYVYAITLGMLLLVIIGGESAKGAARWIPVGGVRLQPSEFAKIGLLLMLAWYLSRHDISLYQPKTLLTPAAIILVPFLLVMKQPDLGTALVFIALSLPMFYWSGMSLVELFFLVAPIGSVVFSAIPLVLQYQAPDEAISLLWTIPWALSFFVIGLVLVVSKPPKFILIAVIVVNLALSMSTNYLWNSDSGLKDYQKGRIISFVNPQADPRGSGYQVIQSMIAIGAGELHGKGFLKGSQVNLAYLPEQHTDFIFSVLGEQFGFVGSVSVIVAFFFIIFRAYTGTHNIRNRFANLLLIGGGSMLAFHVFVNIAMVIGMMPVTGLPLPLLSYGGSFSLTMSMLLGILLTVKVDSQNY